MVSEMKTQFEFIQMLFYILCIRISRISFDYTLNCTKLLLVAVVRDFGIFLTSNLDFSVHLDFFIEKVRKVFACVVQNCKLFPNPLVLKSLYFSLVCPRLEFAAFTRYSVYKANVNKIERVQMRFMRYLCSKYNLDCSLHDCLFWCHNFGISALAQRHTCIMSLFNYKLLRV